MDKFRVHFRISLGQVKFEGDKAVLPLTREEFEGKLNGLSVQAGAGVGFRLVIGLPSNLALTRSVRERFSPEEPITYADLPAELRDSIWNTNSKNAIAQATQIYRKQHHELGN